MPAPRPTPPRVLGRYEVGVKVGGGGMADVYVGRGVSSEGLEELVALKVMRHEYGRDPNFLRMFSDEAKILARLAHPNVIRTLDSGITNEHRYIVMELLAGRTLADVWDTLVERGERLPLRLGAWICARVAAGLHAAHELADAAGVPLAIVHRDVNPSNVFLTHAGVPKLIDFGLAKARVRRTQSGEGIIKGKIPYLAPEQIASRPIDRRIDLYALGATLWEAGTMRRLFKRETDLATLRAIRDGHVPDPREIDPDYPAELAAIVLRALARDPDERHPTADALRAELDAFVGQPSDDDDAERIVLRALARDPAQSYPDEESMRADLDAFVNGPTEAMTGELTALVSRLFPGEEARHRAWRRGAIGTRALETVPPPPLPVPTSLGLPRPSLPEITLDDADVQPDD